MDGHHPGIADFVQFGAVPAEAGPGRAVAVERAADGYRAIDRREAIKVLLTP